MSTAADFTLGALPRLVLFALGLLLRTVLVAAPFAALNAWVLLGDHEINFYLTRRPPAFVAAVGLIGLAVLAMCALLLLRLGGWAIAMQYAVFERLPVGRSFEVSRVAMNGYRLGLLGRLSS